MRRIELCHRDAAGGTKPSPEGAALLLGVEPEHLLNFWDPARGEASIPPHLQRKGHKRTRTARDATGENDPESIIGYWAMMRWSDCRLDFDEKDGKLWAVINE